MSGPGHVNAAERSRLMVQAWLCLLSTGHPYGTWPNTRLELMHLCKHYRVSAASDVALAEALLAAGCGDLLPRTVDMVVAAGVDRCAHAAASNDWEHATQRVLNVRLHSLCLVLCLCRAF